jgi:hypothetical protein
VRSLRVRFYCEHVEGSGQVNLRDGQRLSDLLNLPEHFLQLHEVATETAGKRDRSGREGILLSKPGIFMILPVGGDQPEEMGLTNQGMRVHKVTTRAVVYLPGWRVRADVHHIPGANIGQHLDLGGDSFIPLTDVYVTGIRPTRGSRPRTFRSGFALLNKRQAVAIRLNEGGKVLGLKAAAVA